MTFEKFRDNMLAAGYEEVLARRWAPHAEAPTHPHPFEANALGVHGEMRLSEQGGTARRLEAGDHFHLQGNVPHEERYGPQGAIYWVARRWAPHAEAPTHPHLFEANGWGFTVKCG